VPTELTHLAEGLFSLTGRGRYIVGWNVFRSFPRCPTVPTFAQDRALTCSHGPCLKCGVARGKTNACNYYHRDLIEDQGHSARRVGEKNAVA
jgi:hypothetical protein